MLAFLLALQVSVPTVTYTAKVGRITSGGVYTFPASGVDTITVRVGGLTKKIPVRVVQASITMGVPMGPYRLLTQSVTTAPFTLSGGFTGPSTIVQQITDARARGVRLMLSLTGGAHRAANHGCCLSVINGVLQFDRPAWDRTLATFNTAAIRNAIAQGVTDGTIIGASVMDEPFTVGAGDGNTWGPPGTMTKLRVDSMCSEVTRYFPTLPAGVEHQHNLFEPTKSYRVCSFIVDQYMARMGALIPWRDAGLAMGKRDGHAVLFSMNVLDGGTQDKDGTWDCLGTGGKGTYSPNCRVTATELKTNGLAFVAAGCGLLLWEWSADFFQNAGNLTSFRAISDSANRSPRKACRRS